MGVEQDLHLSTSQVGDGLGGIGVGHVRHLQRGLEGEERPGQVDRGSDAGRCVVELAGAGFDIVDKLDDGFRRQRGGDAEEQRLARHACHRSEVGERVVGELAVEAGIDRVLRDPEQQGVAIGRGARDRVRSRHPARSRPVLDDDVLAKNAGQLRHGLARGYVGARSGGIGDHQLDGAVGIRLRARRGERSKRRQRREERDRRLSESDFPRAGIMDVLPAITLAFRASFRCIRHAQT